MKINPYLMFNGECEAAFKFYEQCLGGKIEGIMPFADTPMEADVPAEWRDKVMHASMIIDDQILMGSDASPGHYEKPQGFGIALHIKEPAEAERLFDALAEDGTIQMPLQQTFWATRFGMLSDRFGIPWMVNCE
jgi:PhnB protein